MKTMTNKTDGGGDQTLYDVLRSGEQAGRANALSSSLTFGWRSMLRIKHLPEQLFDVTVFPVVLLIMFTYLFGGAIAGSSTDYLQFLLPGLLAMTVAMLTMYTGVELNRDIEKGVFDRFRTLPIWLPSPLVGALLTDTVRSMIAITTTLVLGLILGFRLDGGLVGALTALVLLLIFSFSLSWIWTTLALIMRSEKSLITVSTMVIVPLTFISNVLVEPETLPIWLHGFVDVNPISILVSALRGALNGLLTWEQVGWLLIASVIIIAVFAPLTMYLYRNKK
ncbi:ABC transporter permease [Bacillus horti]|uniref:Transport permease protein n=1 Tax=Caldalkalibacillus horti TaxID=77523 RepID=A0ABT9VZW3_9BACI|nr:ABC transporter permease [Bacillus horti]MDQ0166155.1 ABC-2 type transport system permease protein [Bacillus horti]